MSGGHSGARPEFILATFTACWVQVAVASAVRVHTPGGLFLERARSELDWSCGVWASCSHLCRGFSGALQAWGHRVEPEMGPVQ